MKNSTKILTGLLLTAVPLSGQSQDNIKIKSKPNQEKLNVLFIAVDDLRPNIASYGDKYAYTPNIDKIAKDGMIFTRAYCQQAVSNPSRASLLTGLRPDENGVTNLEIHFRDKVPNVVTLPQIFKNNGYLSLGTGKVFHSLPNTVDPVSWSNEVPNYEGGGYVLQINKEGKGKKNSTECADVPDDAYVDGKICNDAIQYMKDAHNQSKPFFLGVGFKKPHAPYCAPKKYWDIYKDVNFEITDRERPVGSPDLAFHQLQEIRGYRDIPDSGPIPYEKEQEIWRGYYSCISFVDSQIGKLLQTLEELGLAENTIIVLWGDHGYHLGEQTLWCKSTNFELDARAPLIISTPKMKAKGQKSNAIVEFVDVYPTLIDLCKIPQDGKLSGISLKPLLNNPNAKWNNIAFNQFTRPYEAIRKKPATHMGYSIRTDDWRCTYWYELATGKVVEKELYNLKDNRIEKVNVSGKKEFSQIETSFAKMIDDYRNGLYVKPNPPKSKKQKKQK